MGKHSLNPAPSRAKILLTSRGEIVRDILGGLAGFTAFYAFIILVAALGDLA